MESRTTKERSQESGSCARNRIGAHGCRRRKVNRTSGESANEEVDRTRNKRGGRHGGAVTQASKLGGRIKIEEETRLGRMRLVIESKTTQRRRQDQEGWITSQSREATSREWGGRIGRHIRGEREGGRVGREIIRNPARKDAVAGECAGVSSSARESQTDDGPGRQRERNGSYRSGPGPDPSANPGAPNLHSAHVPASAVRAQKLKSFVGLQFI